jgi:segregation and condensation protein B
MSLKAKVEAMIYAAEEPITLEQLSVLLKDTVLAELAAARENAAIEQADLAAEADNQELNGPEPGPLMPQSATPELAQVEDAQEDESFREADEPLFAAEPDAQAAPEDSASVAVPETVARRRQPKKSEQEIADDKTVRTRLREILAELLADYASEERGMEIRQIAGGFRMATKPQHHDVVRAFAKSLKPPIRLSLAALETLAVIAYKQPVTVPEISEIRGVDSSGVIATLLDRKLITTSGRKQVIGRPILYKTTKEFLLRFGLNNVAELPSMEEFEKLGDPQAGLFEQATAEATAAPDTQAPEVETAEGETEPAPEVVESETEAASPADETPADASEERQES